MGCGLAVRKYQDEDDMERMPHTAPQCEKLMGLLAVAKVSENPVSSTDAPYNEAEAIEKIRQKLGNALVLRKFLEKYSNVEFAQLLAAQQFHVTDLLTQYLCSFNDKTLFTQACITGLVYSISSSVWLSRPEYQQSRDLCKSYYQLRVRCHNLLLTVQTCNRFSMQAAELEKKYRKL